MRRNKIPNMVMAILIFFPILLINFPIDLHAISLESGDIIATHYPTAEVFLVDPSTGDLSLITSGELLVEPSGVAIDLKGNILIADSQRGVVLIDPGNSQQTLVCSLDGAFGIAVDKIGYIYVSTLVGSPPDSTANIIKIDPADGIPQIVSEDGNLLIPREIEIDDEGKIVVADQGIGYLDDGAIIRIDPETGIQEVVSTEGYIRTIRGLEIENSGQLIAGENRSPAMIIRVDPLDGNQTQVSVAEYLISPVGIAKEENGALLIADNGTGGPGDGGIIRIDPQTGIQTLLVSAATSNGMFTNGRGITVYSSSLVDLTPPELVEFDFTPKTIDVSSGPQIVSFTFRVTDDLSGSDHPNAYFYSPSGTQMHMGSTVLISGTPTNGVWEGQVTFPEFIESGIWYVNIHLNDLLYNRITYSEADLIGLGFPTKLEVTSLPEDSTPPELVEFSFTPSVIDISSGPQTVSFTFRVTDDLSGSDHPNAYFYSPSGTQMHMGSTVLISGTPTNGVWEGQVTFPEFIESGIWYVNIHLNDLLYNRIAYSEADLIGLGFPTKLEVTSLPEDSTPPELVEFSFTPSVIDISSGPQTVSFTFRVTDDLSGSDHPNAYFYSPSGTQMHMGSTVLISGTPTNGVWEGQVTFPEFIESGIWYVNIHLNDLLYNRKTYSEADLIAMGFPTELVVTYTSADTTPPELIELDFTPKAIDISSGPQNVTFTMRITDDITGFSTGTIFFQSPSGQHNVTAGIGNRISGDAWDGIYQAVMVVPQFIENGVYHLIKIELYDGISNYGYPDEQELIAMGFPTELAVTSTSADTTPPELIEFDFDPKTVDISSGPQNVTFTMRITDDITGFSTGTIFFQSPSGQHNVTAGIGNRISGDAWDGIYQAVMVVPQFIENGVYHLIKIELYDGISNYGYPDEQELIAMGFPTELAVTSTSADTTPPELVEFDFTPKSVDVSAGSQNVAFTLRITDDLLGFSYGAIKIVSSSQGQSRSAAFNLANHLVSGDNMDGIYEVSANFPQQAESGIWHVVSVVLDDSLNNGANSEADLIALDFPTELEVVSTLPDATPPELIGFDFTPKSIDVSTGPQDVTFTLRITDDLLGFSYGAIKIVSSSQGQSRSAAFNLANHLVSGDNMDGIYEVPANFPQQAESGTWHVVSVVLDDTLNNGANNEADLIALDFPTELEIVYIEDSDDDGIPDDEDNCPSSDQSGTVIIGGCNSGVENVLFNDGCTISDLISRRAADADNHGQFVSSVSRTTNSLKKEGLISGRDKGKIQSCAGEADIP